jgi:putative methyltransferase (TIGR04325 family)
LYDSKYDIIFSSGTIQYVDSPYKIIEQLKHISHKYLILTRIPIIDNVKDRLTIQHVPKSYYSGSYPAWFLSKERLIKHLQKDYEFIQTWLLENESVVLDGKEIFYYGYLLRNKNFK